MNFEVTHFLAMASMATTALGAPQNDVWMTLIHADELNQAHQLY